MGEPPINIAGAPVSTLCCYGTIALLNLFFVWKYSPEKPSYFRLFAKPVLASALMGAAAWGSFGLLSLVLKGSFAGLAKMISSHPEAMASYLTNAFATLGAIVVAVASIRAGCWRCRFCGGGTSGSMRGAKNSAAVLHLR